MSDQTMRWTSPAVRAAVLEKQRDSIWNPDQFARVMATALAVAGAGREVRILDAGAGTGGMLALFGDVLADHPGATLTCVDREPALVAGVLETAAGLGLSDRVTAQVGDAAALDLADGAFDLAFCQTVLMHAPAPGRVVAELARVTRAGGALVVVEGNAMLSSLNRPGALDLADAGPELLRLWQLIRAGRRALGRGDIAIGDQVPALLAACGVELVEARLVDRILAGPRDQERYAALLARAAPVMEAWRPGFAEAFVAAGGGADDFDRLWSRWCQLEEQQRAALAAGPWHGVLAGLLYAFVGRVGAAQRNSA